MILRPLAAAVWFVALGCAAVAARAAEAAPPFALTLCTEITFDNARTPLNPGDEFLAFAPSLYVAVVSAGTPPELEVTGRVVAAEVAGAPAGAPAVAAENFSSETLRPDTPRVVLTGGLPKQGLAPGRYRVEVFARDTPGRVLAAATFRTRLPVLVPGEAVTLALATRAEDDGPLLDAGAEFGSLPDRLLVDLALREGTATEGDAGLPYSLRVLAEDVPSLSRDRVMLATPPNFLGSLTAGAAPVRLALAVPRLGLPPGRYRVELHERELPRRLVLTTRFTTHETPVEAAGFNLADPELGGLLESVSGEDGAGATWAPALLVRGNDRAWEPLVASDATDARGLPAELTLSFFRRESARVVAVEIDAVAAGVAPKEVEVWGSTTSATDGFARLARFTAAEDSAHVTIPVPPADVRFLRVRILSAPGDEGVSVLGLRVREAAAGEGYRPLAERFPDLRDWRLQPRLAAQRGLHFLQPDAVQWQRANNCLGCHVQSQATLGIAVGRQGGYVVSGEAERRLVDFTRARQAPDGQFARDPGGEPANELTLGTYAALTLACAAPTPERTAALHRAAGWLASRQDADGNVAGDDGRPPVEQGEIRQAANVADVWAAALAQRDDPPLRAALGRLVEYLATLEPRTTQDHAFRILALLRHGDESQRKLARQAAAQLSATQRSDGSWALEPGEPEALASPFATGEALYAMRVAGVSPGAPAFRRGVRYLLATQSIDGSWRDPGLTSPFAGTMWPTIALAGAFSSATGGARIGVVAVPRKPAPPPPAPVVPPVPVAPPPAPAWPKNLVLVLDCSLSMLDHLGKRTRFETAKQVLRDVIAKLPADANVGLRLYGHRHDSMSAPSRTDTQLLVPIGPLDRAALLRGIDRAEAHGQTPLVYATLQAAEDLRKVGGGAIVVVTDGEESCGGKPRQAGRRLAALGVPVRLDVIGFTLKGKRVVEELAAFTRPTGGRFYTADDGAQLAQALGEAVSPAPRPAPPPVVVPEAPPPPPPEDFPYEIFDAAGRRVAAASTLGAATPELPVGTYRVVLHDGARTVTLDALTLADGDELELAYTPDDGLLRVTKE